MKIGNLSFNDWEYTPRYLYALPAWIRYCKEEDSEIILHIDDFCELFIHQPKSTLCYFTELYEEMCPSKFDYSSKEGIEQIKHQIDNNLTKLNTRLNNLISFL